MIETDNNIWISVTDGLDGKVPLHISCDTEGIDIRIRALLSPDQARELAYWLNASADRAEARQNKTNPRYQK